MNSTHSSSTRSVFVSATTSVGMRRSSSTAKCSVVCGMTPSSAAMHRSAMSMPVEPEIIWRTNFSWPGTSTTPKVVPSSRERRAKPSSMVIPRCFSSERRSGSVPVNARISEDLPWSMCPAVPRTRSWFFIGRSLRNTRCRRARFPASLPRRAQCAHRRVVCLSSSAPQRERGAPKQGGDRMRVRCLART